MKVGIFSTALGIEKFFRLVQFWNANIPMLSTEFGMAIASIVHLSKAEFPITLKLSGKLNFLMFLQFWNAFDSIARISSPSTISSENNAKGQRTSVDKSLLNLNMLTSLSLMFMVQTHLLQGKNRPSSHVSLDFSKRNHEQLHNS